MMGVCTWVPFCALEYFIKITKQRDNKESETKKTSKFPNIARLTWWGSTSPKHLVTACYSFSPTSGVLKWSTSFLTGGLLCFISLHISNGPVSTSLVEYVFYSADLVSAICIPHILLIVHRYIYSKYSLVFPMLYQLYHFLPSLTLILSSSFYLKLQPELLLKVVTGSSLHDQ